MRDALATPGRRYASSEGRESMGRRWRIGKCKCIFIQNKERLTLARAKYRLDSPVEIGRFLAVKTVTRQRLPQGIFALGFVSLFMDTSSEMIHSLLPVFLVSVLGASALAVGVIEGIAEGATAAVKVFAGAVSDRSGRRKPLLVLGYGLAALTKPLFPLATGVGMVFAARLIDRIGKGIRGAPRDALVADITPLALRGAAYGLRQSLDTVGAFVGPALALALMAASGDDYRLVF